MGYGLGGFFLVKNHVEAIACEVFVNDKLLPTWACKNIPHYCGWVLKDKDVWLWRCDNA